MKRAAYAEINLSALRHNYLYAKQKAPKSKAMAVIKANAYGHGMIEIAQALQDIADGFAVACLSEALLLREVGIQNLILVLQGMHNPSEIQKFSQYNIHMVVHQAWQIEVIQNTHKIPNPLQVWLKINTGMNRLGVYPQEVEKFYQQLTALAHVKSLRFISHFSSADALESGTTKKQYDLFFNTIGHLSEEKTIANSAGFLYHPYTHCDWVRPGIMLYGISPASLISSLQPVMQLKTYLIAINYVKKGEAIGYNETWICPEDMLIGIAAIGYGDGYPRHAINGTPVLVNQQRAYIVGRVSMDMLILDLRNIKNAKPGDIVILWGHPLLTVAEVVTYANTIAYELLCGVSNKVQYVYLNKSNFAQ